MYPKVEFGSYDNSSFTFVRTSILFSTVVPFSILTNRAQGSNYSTSLQTPVIFYLFVCFDGSHSNGYEVVSFLYFQTPSSFILLLEVSHSQSSSSAKYRSYISHKTRKSSQLLPLHFHLSTIFMEIILSIRESKNIQFIQSKKIPSLLLSKHQMLNMQAIQVKVLFGVDRGGLGCLWFPAEERKDRRSRWLSLTAFIPSLIMILLPSSAIRFCHFPRLPSVTSVTVQQKVLRSIFVKPELNYVTSLFQSTGRFSYLLR